MEADGGSGASGWTAAGAFPPLAALEIEALVRSLVGMMRDGGVTELDLAFGSVTIRLRGRPPATTAVTIEPTVDPATAIVPSKAVPEHLIAAPMIGTYYNSPSPGNPPFVEVGDAVETGQVVGIIEAMKIMNEIVADRAGVVSAILVANGQPVEYGSPLIRLAPAEAGSG